jgi:hypothetical protein
VVGRRRDLDGVARDPGRLGGVAGDLADAGRHLLGRDRHGLDVDADLLGGRRRAVGLGRGLGGVGAHLVADLGQLLGGAAQGQGVAGDRRDAAAQLGEERAQAAGELADRVVAVDVDRAGQVARQVVGDRIDCGIEPGRREASQLGAVFAPEDRREIADRLAGRGDGAVVSFDEGALLVVERARSERLPLARALVERLRDAGAGVLHREGAVAGLVGGVDDQDGVVVRHRLELQLVVDLVAMHRLEHGTDVAHPLQRRDGGQDAHHEGEEDDRRDLLGQSHPMEEAHVRLLGSDALARP